jgi:hypothetical protein
MTDMDPDRPGQEIWICQENPNEYAPYGLRFNDARTGETIFGIPTGSDDVGRCLAADLDSTHRGYELWGSSGSGLYNVKGELISSKRPTYNHAVWWDGDLARELLDGNVLDKWRPDLNGSSRLFTIYQAAPVTGNNDTKKNPCLTADLFGDWREEILLRYSDNTQLVLFTTNIPTDKRIYTLMHDPQYRTAIAWQNSGYNQPPHPSFYLGYGMATPPMPNIELAKQEQTITFDTLGGTTYGAPDFDPGALASSGLKVAYASSNPAVATIVNGKVHLTGVGFTDITATQPGDNRYLSATPKVQPLMVNDSTPPSQPQALTTLKALHEKVQLIWLASTDDIGVAGYYIYRDSIQLNTLPVTGTSFITDAPVGSRVYTYTVIAVDAAGNRSPESAPARFTNSNGHGGGNTGQEVLKLFPNPSDGHFKVQLNSRETGMVTITITNTAGNIIQQLTDRKQGNQYQKEIRLKCATNGLYLVRVTVGAFTQTAIVIIK